MHPRLKGCLIGLILCGAAAASAGDDDGARASRRTPIVDVFEKCRDAVVNISTTRIVRMGSLGSGSIFDEIFNLGGPRPRNQRVQSVGSGVVVHEAGYIVTNAHVVTQASDVQVTFADKQVRPADIVAVDPEHDLAVLKVAGPAPLPFQKLGRSDDIMVGETVVAIGNPLGLQHTVTTGIVSALGRDLQFGDEVTYRGLIQTDAPINPGNSGGPLLNLNAELIGINTAIRGDAQNIGFAIPADRIWELLPQMLDIERRQRVRFGVDVGGTDAKVIGVRRDSPAAKAGVVTGDRIVRLNDKALRDGIDYYVHLLDQKPDSKVCLTVERGPRTLQLDVPLQALPPPDGRALALKLFGTELDEIPADLRRKYDLPSNIGLVVTSVERGAPANRARILAGDMIVGLNRDRVLSLKDVAAALEQVQPGERVLVQGLRVEGDYLVSWSVALTARTSR